MTRIPAELLDLLKQVCLTTYESTAALRVRQDALIKLLDIDKDAFQDQLDEEVERFNRIVPSFEMVWADLLAKIE